MNEIVKKTFQDTLLYITNVLWAFFSACIKIAAFFIEQMIISCVMLLILLHGAHRPYCS